MGVTWQSGEPPVLAAVGTAGWTRAVLRGVPIVVIIGAGLLLLLALRLIERPLFGPRRPVTPRITQGVCRAVLAILGLNLTVQGSLVASSGVIVANHVSWLDIFVLNAQSPVLFVAKAEVAGWPGIGWLARATGTVFIRRDRAEVAAQIATFRDRLAAGHRLVFFPEGTSTDGLRVLPFKPALFATFLPPGLANTGLIQPVTVVYQAPSGTDPRFFGWWGDMAFAPHLLRVLARGKGAVQIIYHVPIQIARFSDRKALAQVCEASVRAGLTASPLAVPSVP